MTNSKKEVNLSFHRDDLIQLKQGIDYLLRELFNNDHLDLTADESVKIFSVANFGCDLSSKLLGKEVDDEQKA